MDNSTSFRSSMFENLCEKLQVKRLFRCAYRPETNGIVERSHRTIKRMAARTGKNPLQMVYWYNVAERVPGESLTAPSRHVHTYQWRICLLNGTATNAMSHSKSHSQVILGPPTATVMTKKGTERSRENHVRSREVSIKWVIRWLFGLLEPGAPQNSVRLW